MVKSSSHEPMIQLLGSVSTNKAMTRNWIRPKKHVNDVKVSFAGYFFRTGAWRTIQAAHDKQCPIRYKHPSVQFCDLLMESISSWVWWVSCVVRLLWRSGNPLYNVIVVAPPMLTIVPNTLATPCLRTRFMCSILEKLWRSTLGYGYKDDKFPWKGLTWN